MSLPDRAAVIGALIAQIDVQLAGVAAMTAAARDEATGSESRPENQYDTRALEASYLAAGQGQRLAELKELRMRVGQLSAAAVPGPAAQGSLLQIALGAQVRDVLLSRAGGPVVEVAGRRVELISTRAPLGAALLGLEAGDGAELDSPKGPVLVEVLEVG